MLAIRMTRHGAKKRPFFHIVVADSRSPRDGRFIEKLGTYNPLLPREHAQRITLDKERIAHWLKVGAQPDGVRGLVRIKSYTEDPMAVGIYGPLSDESGRKEYRVEALSAARGAVLARIEGVADRTAAEALRGLRLYVERERLPGTGEREWYEADLIGLSAVGRDGRDWGKVIAFHDFGAGSVMEVSGGVML